MVSVNLSVLFKVAAVVAFASSAIVTSKFDENIIQNALNDDNPQLSTVAPDFTDDENNVEVPYDNNDEIDGIPLKYLTEEEIQQLLDEVDNIFISELDILAARQHVKDYNKGVYGVINSAAPGGRQKRGLGTLLNAGRLLLKYAIRAAKPTSSGSRTTQQYTKPGNYQDAVEDFNRFSPQNVKTFTTDQGISGQTGTVGDHQITVRDGSKQGAPTLEIQTPKSDGVYVRKFRYDEE